MRIEFADLQRAEAEQIATLERQARREEAYGTPFATRIARSLRLHAEQLREDEPRVESLHDDETEAELHMNKTLTSDHQGAPDTPLSWLDPANRIEMPVEFTQRSPMTAKERSNPSQRAHRARYRAVVTRYRGAKRG